MLQNLFEIRR
uniref:YLP motif containing 1 n=1 Tax=Myotis myotis TaxID=51298 RepID=A0A7J8ASG2_MYOMY|nr:YLP motif containing 1 [Myotis myotis]